MAKKEIIFGIHSVTPYSRADGLPLTEEPLKVLGSVTIPIAQEIIALNGGSSPDPFDIEKGARTTESTMLLKEYPSALIDIALGTKPTENAAEPLASASAIGNVKGTSAVASTGIASVGVKTASEADVKFISAIVKVVSPTTVDVFVQSDVDFAQGADGSFVGDSHKITPTPLTITMGGSVDIPNFGLELTGGAGTIAMVVGDTAVFSSKPINSGSREVVIGGIGAVAKNFGLLILAQKKSDATMHEFNVFEAVAGGLPFSLGEKAYSEAEVTFTPKLSNNVLDPASTAFGLFSLKQVDEIAC